jgi:uncharacterized membrane protein
MLLTLAVNIPITIALFFIGILFLLGKGGFLLSGWNTMSPEKRARYNARAVFTFTGILLIVIAFLMILLTVGIYLSEAHDNHVLTWIAAALLCTVPIVGAIYANLSKRFRA